MIKYTIKNKQNTYCKMGHSNGYVAIHPDHPYYNIDLDELDVSVHGGLTYSRIIDENLVEALNKLGIENVTSEHIGYRILGFDTGHLDDSLETCPLGYVLEEVDNLYDQLQDAYDNQ